MSADRELRIAHFSDLHYGPRHLAEADRCFGAAIDRAIDLGVDAAVLSGDATDHALHLHAPAALRLLAQVRRLADHCPVLMLQGTWSHEPPGTVSVFRMLGSRQRIFVADQIGQVALLKADQGQGGNLWMRSDRPRFDVIPEGTRALFTCIPSINKAAVAAAVGAAAAGQAHGEQIATLLQGYAAINRLARSAGVPTIGASHGTVFGCMSEHGVPMAGFDHEFTTGALFSAAAQAFLLGHIHRHQAWQREGQDGRQCIAYAGSIGRFHHGEQGDKGSLIWDVGPDAACCHLEPTPARRTLDIVFEGRPDLEQLRQAASAQDLHGVSVRVRWSVADEDRHEIDRGAIERALIGAAEVKLEGRIVPVLRTRAPGIAQLADMADKVRAWAQTTNVNPASLLSCLEQANAAEPDQIIVALLSHLARADEEHRAAGSTASSGLDVPSIGRKVGAAPTGPEGDTPCNLCH